MAQISIREYDAKRMYAEYSQTTYTGVLVCTPEDVHTFSLGRKNPQIHTDNRYVIKPDQLFGKRGKYGLLGVNLDTAGVQDWYAAHAGTSVHIGGQDGLLHTFLVERYVPHTAEYYVAIATERDHDVIYFSAAGGVDIEENWDSVHTHRVYIQRGKTIDIPTVSTDTQIQDFVQSLYAFFVVYGFAYLEVNPFTIDTYGDIVCLDMVARVDDSEAYRQKANWGDLPFPHPFGPEKTTGEQYIERLDSETGASLKYRILNPHGTIWLLTSGGGASVILADTLGDMGYAQHIGNYGECSGNPDRESTRAYTATLLDDMLRYPHTQKKYLVIAGAIANFTHIDRTFAGIIDALRERIEDIHTQHVHILVRRGGINDKKGLDMMKKACTEMNIPCDIADGSVYMTEILSKINI